MEKIELTYQEAINAIESNRPTSGYHVLCEALDMACAALREKQVAQQNAPLTLEELRGMDRYDPPILDSCTHDWCAVRPDACAGGKGVLYFGGGCRPLEAGRFYRRPPEQ